MEYVSRSGPVASGAMPAGAGGVVGFEDYTTGVSGGQAYQRAYQTSLLARFAPDTLARSVRATDDNPWMSEIAPEKPEAVSMIGSDVFGPPSFQSTVRNSLLDPRGEAAAPTAYGASAASQIPEGASVASWSSYASQVDPISTSSACGTCHQSFSAPSPIAQPPRIGAYGNPAAAKTARGSVWQRVKSAFYVS